MSREPGPVPRRRLRHALVALAEVVLAAVAGWFAFRCWVTSSVPLVATLADGTRLTSVRYFGDRIAGAIGLGVLAAFLLLDAVRRLTPTRARSAHT